MHRNDPLRNFRFRVEIDNFARAGFADSTPLSYSLSPLNALVGEAMIESLELRVGGFAAYRPE